MIVIIISACTRSMVLMIWVIWVNGDGGDGDDDGDGDDGHGVNIIDRIILTYTYILICRLVIGDW